MKFIYIVSSLWTHYVRRRPGEEHLDECLAPTVKHGGGKIMVWGCFHASGVGILRRVEGKMDTEVYYKILRYQVGPQMKDLAQKQLGGPGWVFQHDNDPKHTAKKNNKFLSNNNFNVPPVAKSIPRSQSYRKSVEYNEGIHEKTTRPPIQARRDSRARAGRMEETPKRLST